MIYKLQAPARITNKAQAIKEKINILDLKILIISIIAIIKGKIKMSKIIYNKYIEVFTVWHMLNIETQTQKDFFTEIIPEAKYVLIYRLYKGGKVEVVYDNSRGEIKPSDFLEDNTIHKLSYEKAFENQRVVYTWFVEEEKKPFFYETTLIPLKKDIGQVDSIFCLIKKLENVYNKKTQDNIIADKIGDSFARLLLKIREEEKRQIASAFHDEVGSNAVLLNSLISILKADLLENKTAPALKRVQELEDVVQSITKRMRKIIISVRPPQLKEIGLNSAIKDLIDSLKSSSKIKFNFSYQISDKVKITEEVKIVLYRCVQESINNVFKHAKAKNIWVCLKEDNTSILLTIKDDGVGYKEEKANSVKKMGLLGMRESATYIGGTFDIKGKKGKGTLVSMRCPKISYIRKVV